MPASLTADDILPLVAKLSDRERERLLRLVLRRFKSDADAYAAQPVREEEFRSDEDPLSLDADGWENVGGGVAKSAGTPFEDRTSDARSSC